MKITLEDLFEYAIKIDDKYVIKYCLLHGIDINKSMKLCGKTGRSSEEMFEFILEHYDIDDFQPAFDGACSSNNLDFAKQIILLSKQSICFNSGLREAACFFYNKDMIDFLTIQHHADNFEEALCYACANDNLDFAKHMVRLGANNFDEAIQSAHCGYVDPFLLKFLLECGASSKIFNYNKNKLEIQALLNIGLDPLILKNMRGFKKFHRQYLSNQNALTCNLAQCFILPLAQIISSYLM